MQQVPIDPFEDPQTLPWRHAHGLGDVDALRDAHRQHLDRLRTAAADERQSSDALDAAVTLATLLAPYRWLVELPAPVPDGLDDWNWRDCPPPIIRKALDLVDGPTRTGRPNGQPSADWLIDQADALGGWLAGSVNPLRLRLRVDSIQIPTQMTNQLLSALQALPTPAGEPASAVDLAVAEAWSSLQSEKPVWQGKAAALLTNPQVEQSACIGLWWD